MEKWFWNLGSIYGNFLSTFFKWEGPYLSKSCQDRIIYENSFSKECFLQAHSVSPRQFIIRIIIRYHFKMTIFPWFKTSGYLWWPQKYFWWKAAVKSVILYTIYQISNKFKIWPFFPRMWPRMTSDVDLERNRKLAVFSCFEKEISNLN